MTMNHGYKMLIGACACILLLGGCSLSHEASMAGGFGDAVHTNQALQIIDPVAGQEEPAVSTLDGPKAERGMERYHKEQRKAPTQRLILDVGGSGTSTR
jgi:hypothetical protein